MAIAVVGPDVPLNEIGRAIQNHAEANGFGVVRAFVGHGIGDTFHMAPQVPHYYDPRLTTRVAPGWAFTIEPMITMGSWRHRMWDDDWTAVTSDLLPYGPVRAHDPRDRRRRRRAHRDRRQGDQHCLRTSFLSGFPAAGRSCCRDAGRRGCVRSATARPHWCCCTGGQRRPPSTGSTASPPLPPRAIR